MKSRISPTAIGVFIAGAIVIIFGSVLLFGSGKLFKKTKDYLLTFREPTTGLEIGAPVKLVGVSIGTVKQVNVALGGTNETLMVNVVVEIDRTRITDAFGERTLHLDDRTWFDMAVNERGLRGRLDVLSLLSGQLYISLGTYPDQPGFQLAQGEEDGLWVIPTLPSQKRELMESLTASLVHLSKTDLKGAVEELKALIGEVRTDLKDLQFEKLGDGLVDTIDKADALLSDPNLKAAVSNLNLTLGHMEELSGKLNRDANPLLASAADDLKKAGVALDEARDMLAALKTQVEPNSTLSRELITTLDQAGQSLEALRELIQQIQRDPSSLLTGKPAPKKKP